MRLPTFLRLLVAWLALAGVATAGSEATDRLDRFRELATTRLGALEATGRDLSPEALHEIYAILDDEIVDSLASGSIFASQGFLQSQLDAFNEAWGGTAFTILAFRDKGLTVGAFQLSRNRPGNSVRIYAQQGHGAALMRTIQRPGVPTLQKMPETQTGDPQFLVAWVGPQSSRGTTGLRVELWRRQSASIRLVWSSDGLVEGDLLVRDFSLRAREVSFRYEVRYPGWKPGCDGQTEHEDLYRYVPARQTLALAQRRVHNGWHQEFQAHLGRFFSVLNDSDEGALAALMADPAHPIPLPTRLEADLACDTVDASPPSVVSVAAVSREDGRAWSLVFRRTVRGWRLAGARPVEPVSATMPR